VSPIELPEQHNAAEGDFLALAPIITGYPVLTTPDDPSGIRLPILLDILTDQANDAEERGEFALAQMFRAMHYAVTAAIP